MKDSFNKVVVIGIDGAIFKIINPLEYLCPSKGRRTWGFRPHVRLIRNEFLSPPQAERLSNGANNTKDPTLY